MTNYVKIANNSTAKVKAVQRKLDKRIEKIFRQHRKDIVKFVGEEGYDRKTGMINTDLESLKKHKDYMIEIINNDAKVKKLRDKVGEEMEKNDKKKSMYMIILPNLKGKEEKFESIMRKYGVKYKTTGIYEYSGESENEERNKGKMAVEKAKERMRNFGMEVDERVNGGEDRKESEKVWGEEEVWKEIVESIEYIEKWYGKYMELGKRNKWWTMFVEVKESKGERGEDEGKGENGENEESGSGEGKFSQAMKEIENMAMLTVGRDYEEYCDIMFGVGMCGKEENGVKEEREEREENKSGLIGHLVRLERVGETG